MRGIFLAQRIPWDFWFAQQGSIIVFVVLIFIYCVLMNRLDARHHAELDAERTDECGDGGSDEEVSR